MCAGGIWQPDLEGADRDLGTRCFPGLLKSSCHSQGGQDLPLAKAAAPTLAGWRSAGLGFLAGVGSEAEVGPPSSRGPPVLRFPEVQARFGLSALPPTLIHATGKTKEPGKPLQMLRPWA